MTGSTENRRRWRLVQDLFHRARELEAERRDAFLRQHCSEDKELFNEVSELLRDALPDDTVGPPSSEREDLSGRTFGNYELLRIVGEGSMGVIYEARQRLVERHVALKTLRQRDEVLRHGGSPEAYERMVRRFVAEAEVLGLLDHPGIVPIHEMEREGGYNYFTMRLVRGDDFRSIIERVHTGADGWTMQRALGVILRVCETMAFAHDRGVLHRDLKPSHVMVGSFGEVYIVDWGLAKLPGRPEEHDLRLREDDSPGAVATQTPAPLRTIEGDVIGTPAYMPPEQARGELGKIDIRSDVYAVGALLYHLLSGRVPYVGPGETTVTARVILERVKQGPPPTLLSRAPSLPPALVAITEKAMRRQPNERYSGMETLAGDLRAFLENRVVTAHRTGAAVELWKWLQRNKVVASAFGLVLLVSLGWIGNVLFLQATKNRALAEAVDEANEARDVAQEQSDYTTATNNFLNDIFRSAHPMQAQGKEVTMRQALDDASARLSSGLVEHPHVEASLRRTLGVSYFHLGFLDLAEPYLLFAYEALPRLLGEEHPDSILATGDYAILLRERGRLDEAELLMRHNFELYQEVHGSKDLKTLRSMGNLCQLLADQSKHAEAIELTLHLLELQREVFGPESTEIPITYETLGSIYYDMDDFEKAEEYYRLELELDRKLYGEDHSSTLVAQSNLASVLDSTGRPEEALEMSLHIVARMNEIFGPQHRNTRSATTNLALLLVDQGAVEDGLGLLRESLQMERELFGADHPGTVQTLRNLAAILRFQGRTTEALPLYRELMTYLRKRLEPSNWRYRRAMVGFADCLVQNRHHEEAVELLREIRDLQERYPEGIEASVQDTDAQLAICYEKLGWEDELQALAPTKQ